MKRPIKYITLEDLIIAFVLTLIFFNETCPLYFHDIYRQSSQNQVNTRSSVKKHVCWPKEFVVSDTNSLEQFADGPEVGKFT